MYFTWNDQGEFHEVERTAWDGLKSRANDSDPNFVGWRGPVTEDREEWAPWSGPVESIRHAPRPAQPSVLPG